MFAFIIYFVGFLLAAKLSWDCNTTYRSSQIAKIIYAFLCGLMNWAYVLTYFFYKRGMCTQNKINKVASCKMI